MHLKLLVKIIFSIFISSLALARGAGGGGDAEELVNQNNGVRAQLITKTLWEVSNQPYEEEFCEAIAEALKKLKLNEDQRILAKSVEVCTDKDKLKAVPQIIADDGTELTARNYPETSTIEISRSRLATLKYDFPPEVYRTLLQAIGVHEILSLLSIESSGDYHVSSALLPKELLEGFRKLNNLEKAIGSSALRKQMSREISDLYIGLTFHHLRDQLVNFSPAFDAEVTATTTENYKPDLKQLGGRYLVPWNQNMLKPILERLDIKIREQKMELTISASPSWSLAIQLHQLLLAVLKEPSLQGYNVKISEVGIISLGSRAALDKNKKTLTVNFKTNIHDKFAELKDMYRFEIIRDYDYNPPPPHISEVLQHWPEIVIKPDDSKFEVIRIGGHFSFNKKKPAYQDTEKYSAPESVVETKLKLGLVTYQELISLQ